MLQFKALVWTPFELCGIIQSYCNLGMMALFVICHVVREQSLARLYLNRPLVAGAWSQGRRGAGARQSALFDSRPLSPNTAWA